MTGPELYALHLAEIAPGTPLAAAMRKCFTREISPDELFALIRWELWECIMSLPPMAEPHGEKNSPGATRPTDASHASACAARADSMLETLRKKLALADP